MDSESMSWVAKQLLVDGAGVPPPTLKRARVPVEAATGLVTRPPVRYFAGPVHGGRLAIDDEQLSKLALLVWADGLGRTDRPSDFEDEAARNQAGGSVFTAVCAFLGNVMALVMLYRKASSSDLARAAQGEQDAQFLPSGAVAGRLKELRDAMLLFLSTLGSDESSNDADKAAWLIMDSMAFAPLDDSHQAANRPEVRSFRSRSDEAGFPSEWQATLRQILLDKLLPAVEEATKAVHTGKDCKPTRSVTRTIATEVSTAFEVRFGRPPGEDFLKRFLLALEPLAGIRFTEPDFVAAKALATSTSAE